MGKASRRKRHRERPPEAPEDLLAARLVERYDDISFRRPSDPPPTLPALAGRLAELMAPFRGHAETLTEVRSLTAIAAFAWNLSLLPDSEHGRFLEAAIRQGAISDVVPFRDIVSDLVERKRQLFPDDTRLIAGHEVSHSKSGFRFAVASARPEREL